MKPKVTVLTLGVDDLDKSLKFYRDGLGFKTDGIIGKEFENGAVVFFELDGGLKLALFERKNISHDSKVPVGPRSPTEFTIGHNVDSDSEVDEVMNLAKKVGAKILKPAEKTFYGGYAGCFQDPDGHVWDVVSLPKQ